MVEPNHRPAFGQEPLLAGRGQAVRANQLEGERLVERVADLPDLAHPPAAEEAVDGVAGDRRGLR